MSFQSCWILSKNVLQLHLHFNLFNGFMQDALLNNISSKVLVNERNYHKYQWNTVSVLLILIWNALNLKHTSQIRCVCMVFHHLLLLHLLVPFGRNFSVCSSFSKYCNLYYLMGAYIDLRLKYPSNSNSVIIHVNFGVEPIGKLGISILDTQTDMFEHINRCECVCVYLIIISKSIQRLALSLSLSLVRFLFLFSNTQHIARLEYSGISQYAVQVLKYLRYIK